MSSAKRLASQAIAIKSTATTAKKPKTSSSSGLTFDKTVHRYDELKPNKFNIWNHTEFKKHTGSFRFAAE